MVKFRVGAYYILLTAVFILIGWYGRVLYTLPKNTTKNTIPVPTAKPTSLNKYTIENLAKTDFKEGSIKVGEKISETEKYATYKYTVRFSPDLSEKLKTVSGIINIPKGAGSFPVIVMFRGFVNQETYTMGTGTQPSAKVFASNGYITMAPDFLGYGDSDKESSDIFESRFQTYVTAVTLLNTISASKDSPLKVGSNYINLDTNNIFIWGHSNGGQIALTTLEITGKNYPTVLWAPVSTRFPASILAYVGEADDGGKLIITKLSEFYGSYDAEKFSLTNYFSNIKAPIQINQGTGDTAVPFWQTDELYKKLSDLGINVDYRKYDGADHNMRPAWDTVVANNIDFFRKNLR